MSACASLAGVVGLVCYDELDLVMSGSKYSHVHRGLVCGTVTPSARWGAIGAKIWRATGLTDAS